MALDPFSLGLSAIQSGLGIYQAISGNSQMNALQKQRTPYKTPEQINQILQLALSQAGGDTVTRDFQTNQLNTAFAGMAGTAQRLGADPNDMSALLQQKINGLMQIGQQFHATNTEAVGRVFNALNLGAENNAAEQKSKDDILKDRIAAAGAKVQTGYQNISGGLNTALATYQADKVNDLYNTGKK